MGNEQLSVVFGNLQLPNSERPILGITIETYDKADGNYYLVDKYESLSYYFFTPNAVTFLFGRIKMSDDHTYTETKFIFENTAATQIPVGSVMKIIVPPQVIIDSTVSVVSSCGPLQKMSGDMKCDIDDSTLNNPDGTHTITITDGFDK